MSEPTIKMEIELPLKALLPGDWKFAQNGSGWRLYDPNGHYYGEFATPVEAIQQFIAHVWEYWQHSP